MRQKSKKLSSKYFESKGFIYRILNEKSYGDALLYFSESKDKNYDMCSIKNEKGKTIYVHSSIQNDVYGGTLKLLFANDSLLDEGHTNLFDLLGNSYKFGQGLISSIHGLIEKIFKENKVIDHNLYKETELSTLKLKEKERDPHGLKILEKNVDKFINEGRYFAGLSYVNKFIKEVKCCVFFKICKSPLFSVLNEKKLFSKGEIDFYSPTAWYIDRDYADFEDEIINNIFSSLISLINKINNEKIIVELCKLVFAGKNTISLIPSVAVKLIDAQINTNSFEYLLQATEHLIRFEPHHPIVELSYRHLRRIKLFTDISSTFKTSVLDLSQMNGIDFEHFLEVAFVKKGFKTIRTKTSGDFGADLIIETRNGTRAAIQAKKFKNKTNLKAVQEVVASISHYSTDFGIVIAISGFFPSAVSLAKSNNVELWDEDKLIRFLSDDLSFSSLSDD